MNNRFISIFCFLFIAQTFLSQNRIEKGINQTKTTITFTENKGQVSDQFYKPRPDVLYSGVANNFVFHLKTNGISYQLNRVDAWSKKNTLAKYKEEKLVEKATIYRLDIDWIGANKNVSIEKEEAIDGYNNYYLAVCPNGALNVKSFLGITYKNIYNKIDLHYYQKNGALKYDYIVMPGADYKQIQLQLKGANKIVLQNDGSLIIKTPLGDIIEGAPIVYQQNKLLDAKWLINGNVLSFEIENYNSALPLLIDPLVAVRAWGTYYGGSDYDSGNAGVCDANGDVYMAGETQSFNNIATVGAQQSVLGYTLTLHLDAFLVKFNTNGGRIWGTYYGGTNGERGLACTVDKTGNVYMAGAAENSPINVVATPGSHQVTHAGNTDGFLVKFNTNGVRLWGTFYGGSSIDAIYSCATDNSKNIFIAGRTNSSGGTVIATPASHQSTFGGSSFIGDAYLVKFDSSGVRQWGTYYGGANDDLAYTCATDKLGNVFISGDSESGTGTVVATSLSYQNTYAGGSDAFLAKFDNNGIRQWATYYGGSGVEKTTHCAVDTLNNIFIAGQTTTTNGGIITTPGGFITTYPMGGAPKTYLVKFDNSGARQWGTYFWAETINSCATDKYNNVYFCGETVYPSVANAGSHQTNFGGGPFDANLAKFDNSGNWLWGTFYGGWDFEYGNACLPDNYGNVYLIGATQSTNNIAVTSAIQPTTSGTDRDGFIAKFFTCNYSSVTVNSTSLSTQNICNNQSASLSASGTGTINWYSSATSSSVLASGSLFSTPILTTTAFSATYYTFYSSNYNGCASSLPRTPISVTVNPNPILAFYPNPTSTVCSGNSVLLTATGANTYTWSTGVVSSMASVSPSATSIFTVIGSSASNCTTAAATTVSVFAVPVINVSSTNSILCLGNSSTLTAIGALYYIWDAGSYLNYQVVTPTVTTIYSVTGINSNGCSNLSTITQSVSLCTGVSQYNQISDIQVFPNPIINDLNLSGNIFLLKLPLQIINSEGKILLQDIYETESKKLNVSPLPAGMYLLRLLDGNTIIRTQKIIIQK